MKLFLSLSIVGLRFIGFSTASPVHAAQHNTAQLIVESDSSAFDLMIDAFKLNIAHTLRTCSVPEKNIPSPIARVPQIRFGGSPVLDINVVLINPAIMSRVVTSTLKERDQVKPELMSFFAFSIASSPSICSSKGSVRISERNHPV
jgi:hypothetical protein